MKHSQDLKDSFVHGTPEIPLRVYNQYYQSGGLSVPYHWHREIELIYVAQGCMEMTIDTDTRLVSEGQFFCINSQKLHQICSIGAENSIHHALVFSPDILGFDYWDAAQEKYITPLLSNQYLLPQEIDTQARYGREVVSVFREMLRLYEKKTPGWYLSMKGYIYQLLGILAREGLLVAVAEDMIGYNRKMEQVKKALAYIHSHYTERIYLHELAEVMQMNPQYFCRFFKELLQKTPIEYINHYRITQAAKMMQNKDASILEVCLCCGFDNPSYFSGLFKKQIGMTPKQYKCVLSSRKP